MLPSHSAGVAEDRRRRGKAIAGGLIAAGSATALAISLAALSGWHGQFGTPVGNSGAPDFTSCIAALILALAGVGGVLRVASFNRSAAFTGMAVVSLGLFFAVWYLLGVNAESRNELLPSAPIPSAGGKAGSNSVTVSFGMLLGLALWLGVSGRCANRQAIVAGTLAACVAGLALVSPLSRIAGIDSSYGWLSWINISLPTAAAALLIGTGLFLATLMDCLRGSTSHALRLEVPAGVASVVLVLLVAGAAQERERRNILEFVGIEVRSLLSEASGRVRDISLALYRMADRWEEQGGTEEWLWRLDAQHYVEDHEALQEVAFADADTVIRWIVPEQRVGSAIGSRLDLEPELRSAVERSRVLRRPVLTSPVDLAPGGKGFLAIVPIIDAGGVQGFIVGGFRFDGLFRSVESSRQNRAAFQYALFDGQKRLFMREADVDEKLRRLVVTHTFDLGGTTLRMLAVPARRRVLELQSGIPEVALGIGLLMSALLVLSLHAFNLSRRREIQAERANASLQEEIRQRRRTERELAAARERLGNIIEAAGEGIYGLDAQGRTTFANPAACRLMGWSDQEMIGRSQHGLIHHSHADGSNYPVEDCPIYATLSDGRVHDVDDDVFWRRDGQPVPVEYVSTPLHDEHGAVVGAVVVFRDVSERKEKEEALRRRSAELAAANKDLESFAYSVSHDLRAPLRSMDGFSQALLEDYGDRIGNEARDYLHRIRRSSQRMALLIDGILAISRVARSQLEYQRVDLSALARDSADAVRDANAGFDATVEIESGLEVDGDPRLLRAVLDNLLSNAFKFSAGKSAARIQFGCEYMDGVPVYFVRDNGAGFDQRYVHKLFQPFQRLHSEEQFEGTGIGLATVARAIHRHGGSVWAEGKLGSGAAIFFSLQPVGEAR